MPISTYTVSSSRLVHETKVDFSYRSVNRTIHVVQYDKQLPTIAVTLYVGGKLYALPDNFDVNVKFGKRDKTFVYKPVLGCNTNRTVVYFEMDEQMTFLAGSVNPIIELSYNDNGTIQRAGSSAIAIEIERNPIQETDIESASEYVDLNQVVADARERIDQIVQGVIDEVEARVDTLETFKDTTVPATYETKNDATSKLLTKVDKVAGKGLSQNDFTDALKNKLDDIESDVNELDTQVKASNDAIALRELLSNKAIDFSIVNDTKYPTTKAVSEMIATTVQGAIDSIESDIGAASIENSIKGDIQSNRNEIINLSNSLLTIPLNSGTIINNAPKGVYATLALLQTAHPTGDTGVYVVAYDAKWYYWNGSNWTAGGLYQSMSLPNENEVATSQIDLVSNNIYKVPPTLSGITLNLPINKSSKFYAELHIQTGASLSVSYSTSDIVWKGEDLDNDGEWIPSGTTSYLLQIKCNGEKYIINVLEI